MVSNFQVALIETYSVTDENYITFLIITLTVLSRSNFALILSLSEGQVSIAWEPINNKMYLSHFFYFSVIFNSPFSAA